MYAKYLSVLAIFALIAFAFFSFYNPTNPTIDTLRTQAEEARIGEEEAQKARMEREDKLSQALYDSCYSQAIASTGTTFAKKQRNAYECWKQQIWTGNLAPESEPPSRQIIPKTSQNVSNQSTLRPDSQGTSIVGNKIQQNQQAQGKWVAVSLTNGSKIPPNKAITQDGKTIQEGSTKSCVNQIILRNGWNDPRVQYAYNLSCWDMDFIRTIEAESRWDVNAVGDKGNSFGLCQINKKYNPEMQKQYRSLKSDEEKIKLCYYQYKDWVKRWVIKTRLYGYNVRNLPQNKNSFTFQK